MRHCGNLPFHYENQILVIGRLKLMGLCAFEIPVDSVKRTKPFWHMIQLRFRRTPRTRSKHVMATTKLTTYSKSLRFWRFTPLRHGRQWRFRSSPATFLMRSRLKMRYPSYLCLGLETQRLLRIMAITRTTVCPFDTHTHGITVTLIRDFFKVRKYASC